MTYDTTAKPADAIVILSTASVPIPGSRDGTHPADTHLAGVCLLLARPNGEGWAVNTYIAAIAAGDPEAGLLEDLVELLPADALLAGWRIPTTAFAPLLSAARAAEPEIALRFLEALSRVTISPVFDLAIEGGCCSVPRHDPTPASPATSVEIVESAWATGRLEPIKRMLRSDATALWRLWLDRVQQGASRASA